MVAKPQDILKEPLVLEFLGLEERAQYSESDLETAIIDEIERFLLELGNGFRISDFGFSPPAVAEPFWRE